MRIIAMTSRTSHAVHVPVCEPAIFADGCDPGGLETGECTSEDELMQIDFDQAGLHLQRA
jgi:hypothetical protein